MKYLFLAFIIIFPHTVLAENATSINDVSGLNETIVKEIIKPKTVEQLSKAVEYANKNHLKISIAGKKHSQGGQIMYQDAIVLDMTNFDKILKLDEKNKVITVQSGVTWEQIQNYLNPYGLSVKVQQSSNIFTVGGSMSVNVHGRDPRFGSLIDTIKGFHLIKPDGKIVYVSRNENSDLFPLVIGGYGLFGIIVDTDIEVTNNDLLEKRTDNIKCSAYPEYVKNHVFNDSKIELHYARPSITKRGFLEDCTVTSFFKIGDNSKDLSELNNEKMVETSRWLMSLSRKYDYGKELRWYLQESILDAPGKVEVLSRNNAMRPPVKFLDYKSDNDTDVLQEYFIPIDKANSFLNELKKVLKDENVNLLSLTLRMVKPDKLSFLSYVKEDGISFVLYINHGKADKDVEKVKHWTRKIVDLAIENNGTYYLTYALYASPEQLRKAYPQIDDFFDKKIEYDSNEIFMNKFYSTYKH